MDPIDEFKRRSERAKEEGEQRAAQQIEKEHKIKSAESEKRQRILDTEIQIPESDLYLVLAIANLQNDKTLKEIKVNDKDGNILWEVKKEGFGLNIRRSLTDFIDPNSKVKIRESREEGYFTVSEEKEVKPGVTFGISAISDHSRFSQDIPKGLSDHIHDLENLAATISHPNDFSTKRVNEQLIQKLHDYVDQNTKVRSETGNIKIGEIKNDLDKGRFVEIKVTHEGQPPIV